MTKTYLVNALKYLLALGLLTYVVWSNWGTPEDGKGLAYVWQRHFVQGHPVNFGAFGLAMTFMASGILCTIIRWYFLVRAVGLPFRFTDALRLSMIGFFFSILLPGGVGGDLVKAVFIAREQDRRARAVATVIIDRVFAVWGIFWFVALSGGLFWWGGFLEVAGEKALKTIVSIAAGVVVLSLIGWTLIGRLSPHGAERFAQWLERRIAHAAAEFWNAIWTYRQQPRVVALAVAISLLGFVGFTLTFHFASRTLWDGQLSIPNVFEHFLIVPIGLLIQGVPLFPGGAGLAELGFAGLYALLSHEKALGVLASLTQRVGMWLIGLIGLYLYLRVPSALKQEPEKVPAVPVLKE